MKIYTLERVTYLPIPVAEAWQFFSIPINLSQITPPDVKFETLTDLGHNPITNGLRIHYRLRPLLNIPIRWETEIRDVEAPNKFMDKQMKGPYAFWEHTHLFESAPGGCKMTDIVRYALPMGILGQMMHGIIVENKLAEIFNFRESVLLKRFGAYTK